MGADFYLGHRGSALMELTFRYVAGEGRIAPRLTLSFDARPAKPHTHIEVHALRADVRLDNERIGTAQLREAVAHVYDHGSPIAVDLPLGLEAVRYAAEQARTTTVELFLDFTGFLRARTEASGQGQSTDVSPWVEADIDRAQGRVSIPRSDWISRAIEPFGTERFVFLEVPIPPPPDLKKWESALTHLKDAERLFREGHDAEVMQRCFAAFESLGARPQAIFNAEPDERKRAQLNESLLATKKFLHAGRHVSGAEELDREFAVDHRDAAFALAQTKVWISYVAHLLQGSAASGRRSGR